MEKYTLKWATLAPADQIVFAKYISTQIAQRTGVVIDPDYIIKAINGYSSSPSKADKS